MDSNLGMMPFSGDLSGAQSIGGLQGMATGMTGAPDGSVFQQMLTQMVAGNTAITDSTGTGGTNAASGKSDDTGGNLLSALLLTGGNTAKARLLNTVKALGESMDSQGQPGESKAAKESGSALEMLQAMMAGLNGTVSAANMEKIVAEIQNGTSAAKTVLSVASDIIGVENQSILGNKQFLEAFASQDGIPQEKAAAANQAVAKIRNLVMAEAKVITKAARQTVKETGTEPAVLKGDESAFDSAKPAGSKKMGSPEPANFGLIVEAGNKTARPFANTSTDDGQILTVGTADKEASTEKLKAETIDGMDPDRIGLQNSVQGPVTANATPEANPQAQQVQAPEQYGQIRDEILAKLEKNGPTEFKMQLEPEDLGQIDIKLKFSEGKLVIDILAANSKTQELLTSQVDKLISSMGLRNVQVESVQVSQQMNQQSQDNSQSQGFNMNSAMDFSQRRQQEQHQQQIFQNANRAGIFSLQQDETQANSRANRIESIRYDSHRMNYTV